MATFNGMPWIRAQVASVLEQEDVNVQLTISDDGSTDDTREWVEELASEDDRVRVLPRHGGKGGVAPNFLYALANLKMKPGQYAAFCDQDDLWRPRKLARQIAFLKRNHANAVSGNVSTFTSGKDVGLDVGIIRKDQPQVDWDFIFEAAGPGSTYLLDYAAWQTVVSYLDRWGAEGIDMHDWFVYAVLRAAGMKWAIDKVPHVDYRQHAGNVAGAHRGAKAIIKRLKMLLSGHYRKQFQLITAAAIHAAEDAQRSTHFLDELRQWSANLADTSPRGRLWVARRMRQMRRRPSEGLALATAGLLGVW